MQCSNLWEKFTHVKSNWKNKFQVAWNKSLERNVGSSSTPVSDNCILPTLGHLLSVGRTAVLETGPVPPQDHKSGAVCCPISDYVGYWWHFYLDSEASAQCELFLTVLNINILTQCENLFGAYLCKKCVNSHKTKIVMTPIPCCTCCPIQCSIVVEITATILEAVIHCNTRAELTHAWRHVTVPMW